MRILLLIFVLYLLKKIFGHRHSVGYTKEGLPVYSLGKVDRFYKIYGDMPMVTRDDESYPTELFDSYSQTVFRCRCGKNLVEHR